MSDELSAAEQALTDELSGLAVDPSPAARASIMRAVRASRLASPRGIRHLRPRLLAVLAALLLVITGSIGVLAASSEALPHSPAYKLRFVGEDIRLAIAGPVTREQLRIQFARDRFRQATGVVHQNRSDAKQLVADGSNYLVQTQRDLQSLSAGDQGQVQDQLNQAGQDQSDAENQVNQEGDQQQ